MEDTTRLKIILVGLFLAALALGYLIFAQRKTTTESFQARPVAQMETTPGVPVGGVDALGQSTTTPTNQPSKQLAQANSTTAQPTPTQSAASPQANAANTQQTKGGQPQQASGASTLPSTGIPSVLLGIFSASASLAGWKLRRFPK